MSDEEKTNEQEQEQEQEQSVAEVLQSMRDEYEERLRAKDAELESLKTKHAREVRDILTGRDANANKQIELNDRVKTVAEKIKKNLGI
jgi:hypothetical protein